MPRTDQTADKLKWGIRIPAEKHTTIQLMTPKIEILVGGPYRGRDGMHTYGHMALRVVNVKQERVYDFGRYGRTNGEFSATGEGILRVWSKFGTYIFGENSYGRTTKGFSYSITEQQSEVVFSHYSSLIAKAVKRRSTHQNEEEFKLIEDYHAISNNCTTMALAGVRLVLPGIDEKASVYNEGRGMSSAEKIAARASGFGRWPSHIFMPADVQVMLEIEKKYVPMKTEVYKKI